MYKSTIISARAANILPKNGRRVHLRSIPQKQNLSFLNSNKAGLLREAPIPSGSFKGPVSVCVSVRTYVRPRFR